MIAGVRRIQGESFEPLREMAIEGKWGGWEETKMGTFEDANAGATRDEWALPCLLARGQYPEIGVLNA